MSAPEFRPVARRARLRHFLRDIELVEKALRDDAIAAFWLRFAVAHGPLAEKTVADYGADVAARLEVLRTTEPAGRKAGVKVKDVAELVSKLKNEAGVL